MKNSTIVYSCLVVTVFFFLSPTFALASQCAANTAHNDQQAGNNTKDAFGFVVAGGDCTVSSVILNVQSIIGSPTDVQLSLQADSSGNPSGSALDTCSKTGALGTGLQTFVCSGSVTLTNSATYWAVMALPSPGSDYPILYIESPNSSNPESQYFDTSWHGAGNTKYLQYRSSYHFLRLNNQIVPKKQPKNNSIPSNSKDDS